MPWVVAVGRGGLSYPGARFLPIWHPRSWSRDTAAPSAPGSRTTLCGNDSSRDQGGWRRSFSCLCGTGVELYAISAPIVPPRFPARGKEKTPRLSASRMPLVAARKHNVAFQRDTVKHSAGAAPESDARPPMRGRNAADTQVRLLKRCDILANARLGAAPWVI